MIRTYARHGYRFVGDVAEIAEDAADAADDGAPRWVRSGDVHVAYRTAGAGAVDDIVLVLGWSLSMRSALALRAGRALVRELAAHARVVLFDKRGTGASDRVKALPSLAQRVDDLDAVLDAVRSPGAILVGFSEGGPLAIAYACRRPARVRGLALVGAFARMASAPDHPDGWRISRRPGLAVARGPPRARSGRTSGGDLLRRGAELHAPCLRSLPRSGKFSQSEHRFRRGA